MGVFHPRWGLAPGPTCYTKKQKQPAQEGLSQGPDPAPLGPVSPSTPVP